MTTTQRGPGDEERFSALFAECFRPLLAYALRRVGDPADAADVVAETFLVAWRRLADVPPGDEARLWLFGVARRVLGNQRRGGQRRSDLAVRLRAELATVVVDGPASPVEAAHAVTAAMAALGEDDREILRLTGWEELTPAEAAVVLQVPAVTARTRLHRARGRLRAALATRGWEGERSEVAVGGRAGERLLAHGREGER